MKLLAALGVVGLFFGCQSSPPLGKATSVTTIADPLLFPGEEKFLKNIRQLTFGGQNAEAYFSADGQWLVFQAHREEEHGCDELYVMRIDGSEVRKISNGKGRVTCGYFAGLKNPQIIFASTHDHSADCPAKPDFSRGYVWPIYDSYELYSAPFKGSPLKRLTNDKFYDAEATVSPDQKNVVFTSNRDGDLDLYIAPVGGDFRKARRITKDLGYDGGAFFSHDGKKLIYRSYHPETEAAKAAYKANLKNGIYRPTYLELFVINTDGTERKQITNLRGGTFAPFFFPGDQKVIFASNYEKPRGRNFNLYMVNVDGTGLERVTNSGIFDSFPMFSPDGKKLVWASNRNGKVDGETNIFIADWIGPAR
jgi:TolB protein